MSDDTNPPAAPQHAPGISTRTVLEIVGGVAAGVLIVVAAGAGFAAGLVVGDDDDRRGGYDLASDTRSGGHHEDGIRGGHHENGMVPPPMGQPES